MEVDGAGMQMMNPAIHGMPLISAVGLTGSPTSVHGVNIAGIPEGRMDQLVKLINTLAPGEILMALLLANTIYRQSPAPPSITLAAIELQLAIQTLTAETSKFPVAMPGAAFEATGSQLNTRG